MATGKEYLAFILDQLSLPEDVSCRAMMGEYKIGRASCRERV